MAIYVCADIDNVGDDQQCFYILYNRLLFDIGGDNLMMQYVLPIY